MEDCIGPLDELADLGTPGVELDRVQCGRVRARTAARARDGDDLVPALAQESRGAPAEEPGCAGDQELHRARYSATRWRYSNGEEYVQLGDPMAASPRSQAGDVAHRHGLGDDVRHALPGLEQDPCRVLDVHHADRRRRIVDRQLRAGAASLRNLSTTVWDSGRSCSTGLGP